MATEAEVEEACEEIMEKISDVGDDTERFSQEDSAEFYESIARDCSQRAALIRKEMEE